MPGVLDALVAFVRDHKRCGNLEGGHVWLACSCGGDHASGQRATSSRDRPAPGLLLGQFAPLLLRSPARLDPHHPWRLIARWFRGRARIEYLNIVSHHFMGRTELATATGRERLALCVFKAPVGDRLVSMCELNALGLRDHYYDGLREADRRTHPESSNAARSLHAGGEIVEPLRSSRSGPVGR